MAQLAENAGWFIAGGVAACSAALIAGYILIRRALCGRPERDLSGGF